MYVIIQTYDEKNNERRKEIEFCIQSLIRNNHITKVIDLSELKEPTLFIQECNKTDKYVFKSNNEWLTYNSAIKYAFKHIPKGEMVALMNNDIFLSESQDWSKFKTLSKQFIQVHNKPVLFTFTRHEWGSSEMTSYIDPSLLRANGCNSQDVWMWINGIISPNNEYEIPIGILGCDNAILDRFYFHGKVIPYNMGDKWRVYHYDRCRQKTAGNSKHFHKHHKKQQSRGYEKKGSMVLPYMSAVPKLIKKVRERESLENIKQFSKQYELFITILQNYIKINN